MSDESRHPPFSHPQPPSFPTILPSLPTHTSPCATQLRLFCVSSSKLSADAPGVVPAQPKPSLFPPLSGADWREDGRFEPESTRFSTRPPGPPAPPHCKGPSRAQPRLPRRRGEPLQPLSHHARLRVRRQGLLFVFPSAFAPALEAGGASQSASPPSSLPPGRPQGPRGVDDDGRSPLLALRLPPSAAFSPLPPRLALSQPLPHHHHDYSHQGSLHRLADIPPPLLRR